MNCDCTGTRIHWRPWCTNNVLDRALKHCNGRITRDCSKVVWVEKRHAGQRLQKTWPKSSPTSQATCSSAQAWWLMQGLSRPRTATASCGHSWRCASACVKEQCCDAACATVSSDLKRSEAIARMKSMIMVMWVPGQLCCAPGGAAGAALFDHDSGLDDATS
eukprot:1158917-Pelagomonas_calceolata.AAC.8